MKDKDIDTVKLKEMNEYLNSQYKNTLSFMYKKKKNRIKIITDLIDSSISEDADTTQDKEYVPLKELYHLFKINEYNMSNDAQKIFWHEYGHMSEAIKCDCTFILLVVIDTKNKKQHLFYNNIKNNSISYLNMKSTFCNRINKQKGGVSYFYKHNMTPAELKKIAFGGLRQDIIKDLKKKKKMLSSFGLQLSLLPFTNKTGSSDLSFFTEDKSVSEYQKHWRGIYNYLYCKGTVPSKKEHTPKKFPLKKYKVEIEKRNKIETK
ncbi:hypothetical protein [Brochothrix thermosphacta]|uniref:Uncharacterized protein n=3 Tax=Brochothrix thermosphacta TaxID=2756 RepID=A0A2X0R5H2_BROTH|nr:hypothetical protein [Brochothrix thermosphacta]SPP29400.1 hypothetical protein BTBSAS_50048 [Brochothrix thermosphacta]